MTWNDRSRRDDWLSRLVNQLKRWFRSLSIQDYFSNQIILTKSLFVFSWRFSNWISWLISWYTFNPQSWVSRSPFWDSIEQVPTVMRSWQFLNWFLSILCMMFPPSPIVSMLHTWNKSVGNIESWKIFPDLYFEPFLSYFVIFKVQISKFQIVFEKFRINKFNLVVFKRIHRRLRPQLNWSGSKQWSGPWIPNLEDKCALFQD